MSLVIFHRACQRVYDNRAEKSLTYAVSYALTGLMMSHPGACQVQCLYIMQNMTRWRGAIAKECREDFNHLSIPSSWE